MLPAGFLSVRSGVVVDLQALCPKCFMLEAVMFGLALPPCGGEKKQKKKGGKNSSRGGKKYSLASFGSWDGL